MRETQDGRGTLSFDYRILASAAGRGGERMRLVTPAVAAKAFPMVGSQVAASAASGPPPSPPRPRRRG